MPDDAYIKVGCTKEFRDAFLGKAKTGGTTGKAILLPIAEAYLAGETTAPEVAKRPSIHTDPDHHLLDVILKKGTKDQILGIRSNLQAFNEAIELRELKATKSPHRKTAGG